VTERPCDRQMDRHTTTSYTAVQISQICSDLRQDVRVRGNGINS